MAIKKSALQRKKDDEERKKKEKMKRGVHSGRVKPFTQGGSDG